jgi:hypothetical protein
MMDEEEEVDSASDDGESVEGGESDDSMDDV